jgi:hypothetical protein
MSLRRSSRRRVRAPVVVAELVPPIDPITGILPTEQLQPINIVQAPCTVSQAQILFLLQETKQQYDPLGTCSVCGLENVRHPMSVAGDPQEMLKAVFNPETRERKAPSDYQQKMLEVNIDKAVRDLSEHSQIKGTFNPLKQLTKVFLQEYESRMCILAGHQHVIWIRVLPAVLHWSIITEFTWVNTNISLIPDMTWDEAKRLFSDHWRKTNSHFKLKTLYNNVKQGPQQSINEYANEFRKQMQLNDLAEDQGICDDFLMKMLPAISNQVLLQLRLREQAGLIAGPLTLDQLEDTARLIDSASESPDDHQSTPPLNRNNNRDFPRNDSKKRLRDKHSNNNHSHGYWAGPKESAPSTKSLQCDNHPNSASHSTAECRLKRVKPDSETAPRDIKQEPGRSTDKSSTQSYPKKPRLTPQDNAWVCFKCKQKAPGHLPQDCPQK